MEEYVCTGWQNMLISNYSYKDIGFTEDFKEGVRAYTESVVQNFLGSKKSGYNLI